jgi:hypothetical protein
MNGPLKYTHAILLTLTGWAPCPFCDGKSIPLLYSWKQKFKSTLHPVNVQMVTARIEACKQQSLLGYILLEYSFGCEENVSKERAYSTSSVFKISMNKYSNHWLLSVTLSTIDQ